MKSIVLIDVAGAFFQFWHATEHEPLGSAFTKTVEKVHWLARGYDHAVVCYDVPPYIRKGISPDYKAQRDKPPEVLVEQYRKTRLRLAADGFPVIGIKGYESDDIIASFVEKLRGKYIIRVASSDKDLTQLANDEQQITVCSIGTGALYNEAEVRKKFGVNPVDVRDWLALVGDKGDNINGVHGVGPVAAAKIINSPEGLDGLLNGEDVEGVTPRIHELIRAAKEDVKISRKLVTLMTDAPVDVEEIFKERIAQPLSENSARPGGLGAPEKKEDMQEKVSDAEFSPVAAQTEQPQAEPVKPVPAPETAPLAKAAPAQQTPSTALALVQGDWALALEPRNGKEAYSLAVSLHDSRLFPALASPEAILAVVLRGRSLGIDAVTSLSGFHVIEGRVTLSASLLVGLIQRSGKAEYFDLIETTSEKATWVTKRRGARHEVKLSWGLEDAAAAGFMIADENGKYKAKKPGSNWEKYGRTMIRWRCACELGRAVYPDIVSGLYTPDELDSTGMSPEVAFEFASEKKELAA